VRVCRDLLLKCVRRLSPVYWHHFFVQLWHAHRIEVVQEPLRCGKYTHTWDACASKPCATAVALRGAIKPDPASSRSRVSRPECNHQGAPGRGSGSILGQLWRRWLCWPFCPGGHRRKRSSTLMARLQASAQVILVSVAGEVLTSLEAPGCAWISATIPAYPVPSVCICLLVHVSQAFRSFCPGQHPNRKSQSLRLVAFQGSCASAGAELRDGQGGKAMMISSASDSVWEWGRGHLQMWT
jgi:hypothetical protein